MKKGLKSIFMFLLCYLILSCASVARTQQETGSDKTLSPYFFVLSDDIEVDQLPLQSTSAQVDVVGVIADITVKQVYKNAGKNPIEAIYVFPASTRAAVYGMKMTIGERTIVAEIQEKQRARQTYEQAKQAGKSASLLEQQRPNVFQMNVANILPGDVIEVELKYTELLIPTDGVYVFVYPTVVGPRYSNQPRDSAPASEGWVENPYLHEGEKPTYQFDLKVNLSTGVPIQEVICPSHKTTIQYEGKNQAVIGLDPSEEFGGNRDFIIKYRLSGGSIESGLLLYEGNDENFFLCMIQPPKRVKINQIPPREYIFIVDISGSMHGFPINISKELLKDLIGNLRPTDTFNVLLFAGSSSIMAEHSLPATKENIQKAIDVIERQRGGGGTELLPALQRALNLPYTEDISRTIVIATDGYVTVEKEAFDLIQKNLGNANFFAFGIGTSVNRYLIEGMARAGMGEPFVVTQPDKAKTEAERFRKMIETPVLTNINIEFGTFKTYDVEPVSTPDMLAERPIIIFGKWRGTPKGTIKLKGITGHAKYSTKIDVSAVKPDKTNSALRYLWARHKIAILSDYNRLSQDKERIAEVTSLGLTYNLLTDYTSFVAVDSEVRLKDGKATTVKQPLPLPEGVSDYAVGRTRALKATGAPQVFAFPEGIPAPQAENEASTMHTKSLSPRSDKGWDKSQGVWTLSKDEEAKKVLSIVLIEKIEVGPNLSGPDTKTAIEQNMDKVVKCVTETSGKVPAKSGKITIEIDLDAAGGVSKINLKANTLNDKDIEACLLKAIEQIRFPASADGKAGTIELVLKIRAGN